jgi:drug/metabolite transporter (DMT)-like permease
LARIFFGGKTMKALMLVGVVLLVLGVVSFFVPVPHSEHHGVNLGDAHVGITTHDDEKVAPAVSIVLVVVGAGLMIAGRKN